MKKIFFIAFMTLFAMNINAQDKEQADPNAPIMTFEKTTIDYGTIEKGSDGTRFFKFTNTGKSPLKINRVKSSCGCTIPKYPKEDIMPGESNVIEVKYDTNTKSPRFSKSVSIYSNTVPERTVLRIKGIINDPNAPAPIQKKKSMMSTEKN